MSKQETRDGRTWCVRFRCCWGVSRGADRAGMRRASRSVVKVDSKACTVSVHNPEASARDPPKMFTFDQTYGDDSTQREVYERSASVIVGTFARAAPRNAAR